MIRSISVSRPTTGSSLPSSASFVRLRPNWSSSFEDFLPSPDELPERAGARSRARAGALTATAGTRQHPDDLVADLLGVRVEVEQDARGDALVLANESEQDVLGADVVVAQAQRLAQRQLEDLLRARRERDLAGRDLLARSDDPNDLGTYALDGDVEALEDPRSEAFLLTEEAEQNVLGPDVVVLERARFFLRENDHLTGSLCESLEHAADPFLLGRGL